MFQPVSTFDPVREGIKLESVARGKIRPFSKNQKPLSGAGVVFGQATAVVCQFEEDDLAVMRQRNVHASH